MGQPECMAGLMEASEIDDRVAEQAIGGRGACEASAERFHVRTHVKLGSVSLAEGNRTHLAVGIVTDSLPQNFKARFGRFVHASPLQLPVRGFRPSLQRPFGELRISGLARKVGAAAWLDV